MSDPFETLKNAIVSGSDAEQGIAALGVVKSFHDKLATIASAVEVKFTGYQDQLVANDTIERIRFLMQAHVDLINRLGAGRGSLDILESESKTMKEIAKLVGIKV